MEQIDANGYLTDDHGHKSSMRLMCLLALIASVYFGAVVVHTPEPTPTHLGIVFGFLIGAFAPKAVQKYAESRLK